ncbi:riboflavin synthase [Lewinella marina]|uniref:Riboflavin synthase n=1 Tax=Neolewinella marina TaxID=438751 RepID=A0A2G0CFP8_9BACT|nr:riboflavin synthase [Neolewinella marina]NJB85508.1 riboflavin synthase [Neolewinella marina]PHK98803.1 riboflavin synthase [Neolewinella marina]
MFTGIIETAGTITAIEHDRQNVHFTVSSDLGPELKIDQSLAHDGVCLTVVALDGNAHTVTAIRETLDRTRLGEWRVGGTVNLERAMQAGARLDGHIVQGHVDTVAECLAVEESGGSWYYTFRYATDDLLVDKGSICVNGVSLTVVEPTEDTFRVAIIPYTHEHTNFKQLQAGDRVNLEFDIIGKYIARQMAAYRKVVDPNS